MKSFCNIYCTANAYYIILTQDFHLLFECKSNDLNSSSVVEESDCFTKYLHQFMSKLRRLLQQLIVGLSAETMCGGLRVRMSIATNRPNRYLSPLPYCLTINCSGVTVKAESGTQFSLSLQPLALSC